MIERMDRMHEGWNCWIEGRVEEVEGKWLGETDEGVPKPLKSCRQPQHHRQILTTEKGVVGEAESG